MPQVVTISEARARGLSRYFTRDACPRGHVAERYVKARTCVICAASKKKVWADKNPEKVSAYNKRTNAINYSKTARQRYEKFLEWKADNPQKFREMKRADYLRNRDKRRAATKQWRENNLEFARELDRRKRAANPEQYRTYKRNAKARRKNALGSHTGEDVIAIFKAQKGKCAYCRDSLPKAGFHVDHIYPIILGGSNNRTNLQVTCAGCNLSKQARDPIVFAREIGMLI